jgi:hypothetical protein
VRPRSGCRGSLAFFPRPDYGLTLPSSTRTVPSPKLVTNTGPPSGVTATLVGLLPAAIRAVSAPLLASTTAIVPSSTLAVWKCRSSGRR